MEVKSITLTDEHMARKMINTFRTYPPDYAAFDTETTGLHIIHDRPFLYQFGWINLEHDKLYTFVVDLERQKEFAIQVIKWWQKNILECKVYAGHNVKYDLHMMHNIKQPYYGSNITDTMIYIRAAMDNIPTRAGGAPLKLKDFTTRYIDKNAKQHEKLLKAEKTSISKGYNLQLQRSFNRIGKPDGAKSWTKGYMDEMFNDICFNIKELDIEYQTAYEVWLAALPKGVRRNMKEHMVKSDDIPYNLLDRKTVIEYGHLDIVYTLQILYKLSPIIDVRKTWNTVKRENECIYPLFDMERVGFLIDKPYLMQAIVRTKDYIKGKRKDLHRITNSNLKVNQHQKFKQICEERYGVVLHSTGSEELDLLVNQLKHTDPDNEIIQAIEIVQELRTLEKWIKVYMMRFMIDLRKSPDNRIYTSINQVGAASGRVTSDFQQFPKAAIKSADGEELFSPRKMVLSEGNGLVYLDYSQIELRLQALYTILVGTPDLNLCRAYMPYKCWTLVDYNGPTKVYWDMKYFNKHQEFGNYDTWDKVKWHLEESDLEWIPTDVHGATTKAAFHITEDNPNYKKLRSYGKRVNFAKNYGAQRGRIRAMFPEMSEEEITNIDGAYYKAFPGIKAYQDYCYKAANSSSNVINLLGVRYYGVSGHNLINMLIQGSGAYFLKEKIVAISVYLQNHYSKFQMNIHDELSFIWDPRDDFSIFYEIKEIMEEWDGCLVPIVADMELTTTNWAEKEDV